MEQIGYWIGYWAGRLKARRIRQRVFGSHSSWASPDPLDHYGDALRQALHAEADCVVPASDGLDRIRVRVTRRRWYRHGSAIVAGLLLLNVLLLLTLGGS